MFRLGYTFPLLLFQTFRILQHCSRMFCLTIDNRLTVAANDCYIRISIGSKLPDVDIVLQTDVTSLTECRENCSAYRNGCNAFSFGVGVKGNGTCLISLQTPSLDNLQAHPEYDVYARKSKNSLRCHLDRLHATNENRYGNYSEKLSRKGPATNIGGPFRNLIPTSTSISIPFHTFPFSRKKNATANYGQIGVYHFLIDHDKTRSLSGSSSSNRTVLASLANKNEGISPTAFVPICHRKLHPSKRMTDLLIERVVNCENLQDCCRVCDYEKTFVCKGFNHRRRTDDSKCSCELTSTPYSRMHVDEHFSIDPRYDYYEKNEHCPSSMWHANLIPNRKNPAKNDRPIDQNMWLNRENVNVDFSRVSHKHIYPSNGQFIRHHSDGLAPPNERYRFAEQQPYGYSSPYSTSNWNRDWRNGGLGHSDIINDNTVPNVNCDQGYLSGSGLADRNTVHEFFIPNEDEHFYGKFYNYGAAFAYNTNDHNDMAIPRETRYKGNERSETRSKCSVKAISGSTLSRTVVQKTCFTFNFVQCEYLCTMETSFSCKSFAYRYNLLTTNPTDNCLLSDRSYRDFNFYTDLEPNRDYDTYVLMPEASNCYSGTWKNRYSLEECFARIRSGFGVPIDVTRKSMFASNLGECQLACTDSQEFLCRSLVFKFGVDNNRWRQNDQRASFNCFLTDWSSEEINPIDMPDMDGAELYERSTFSRGCDLFRLPPSDPKGSTPLRTDELCYSRYHRPCRLMPHAVVSSMRTATKSDCRHKCSNMRNSATATTPCMSFNYITDTGSTWDNCFLSDIPIRDLRPNLDYVHDNNDRALYTWKDYDPYCRPTINAPDSLNATIFPSAFAHPNTERSTDDVTSGIYEHDYGKLPLHPTTFQHGLHLSYRYTVNGYPCKNGTECQRNEVAGFWSCEVENEYGSWDYCCDPSHSCGFSQGYRYPWCYVGPNEDQWRPCSETYYPYHLARDRSIYRRKSLYTGRHWPVIYFHETPPSGSPPSISSNRKS